MNRLRAGLILITFALTGTSGILLISCRRASYDGMIIFTEVSRKTENNRNGKEYSVRYLPGSRIAVMDPSNPDKPAKVLTSGYYSARSPEISNDGTHLLFTGQLKENDPWQIWEMNLASLKVRQVTSSNDDCTDPAYLPLGQIVFSKFLRNDSLKSEHSLFTGNIDGSDFKRITYNPHTYLASTVLNDGRILSVSRRVYPERGNTALMVMRPDGTKYELFYQGNGGSKADGRCRETIDRKIFFIESDSVRHRGGDIIAISYNRPLHSAENLTSGIEGEFQSVFPEQSGKLLVSFRRSASDSFTLVEFDPEKKVPGKTLYNDSGYDVLEAIEVRAHQRPRKLPSEVHMDIRTGLIVCQDVNLSNPPLPARSLPIPEDTKIEIMGLDSSLGIVQTEKDGSFYLKIIADKPFKLRSLDNEGRVTAECGWLWLRPNERRGCVGCHEDHELAPENRVPLSVKKSPTSVPVHISSIKEKLIDTE
jgi:Hydrazine synthase alpha subunit middle domain